MEVGTESRQHVTSDQGFYPGSGSSGSTRLPEPDGLRGDHPSSQAGTEGPGQKDRGRCLCRGGDPEDLTDDAYLHETLSSQNSYGDVDLDEDTNTFQWTVPEVE